MKHFILVKFAFIVIGLVKKAKWYLKEILDEFCTYYVGGIVKNHLHWQTLSSLTVVDDLLSVKILKSHNMNNL